MKLIITLDTDEFNSTVGQEGSLTSSKDVRLALALANQTFAPLVRELGEAMAAYQEQERLEPLRGSALSGKPEEEAEAAKLVSTEPHEVMPEVVQPASVEVTT